jgi:antirestriction protein ArdC
VSIRKQFLGNVPYNDNSFHEPDHWTGHESGLNRSLKHVFGSDEYAKEELIAELSSAFLCAHLGFSLGITNKAAYIQDWVRVLKADPRYLLKVLHLAENVVELILSSIKPPEQRSVNPMASIRKE